MAITGHKKLEEVSRYTARAEQARLAEVAIKNMSATESDKPDELQWQTTRNVLKNNS